MLEDTKLKEETQNKGLKILIIIFVLIIFLGLIIFIFFFKIGKGFDSLYSTCLKNCEKGESSDSCESNCRDYTNYELAIEKKNISYCENINYEFKKEYCLDKLYMYNAISSKDLFFCKKIINANDRNNCLLYNTGIKLPMVWKVGEKEKIILSEKEWENSRNFEVYDTDEDGFLDSLEFTPPSLDEIIYDIFIKKAEHLSSNKENLVNIYEEVKNLDNVWSETINENEYLRIVFEKKLDNKKDITIYSRVVSGSPRIGVYENGKEQLIAVFENITKGKNTIYLTSLVDEQDTFDLKIVGGSVEFDWIVDPFVPGCAPDNIDCTNTCDLFFTPSVVGWNYKRVSSGIPYNRCQNWNSATYCLSIPELPCNFYSIEGQEVAGAGLNRGWYQQIISFTPFAFYNYYCPSFEGNGNFPVTESNCVCSQIMVPGICNDPDYSLIFDFSSQFFCKNICTAGVKQCFDGSSYQTCGLNGYSCLNFGTSSTPCPVATPHCIGAGTCVQCLVAGDCSDPGICLNPACNSNACASAFVALGVTDTGCVGSTGCVLGASLSCRCNGAGTCVECNAKSDCPADSWTTTYRCNPTNPQQIQRQSLNYTCGSNTCNPSNPWNDKTLCVLPDVCFNPTGPSTCCTPDCYAAECGSDSCGGSCGDCDILYPGQGRVCSGDGKCETTGDAYWANMNGEMIGDGSSRIHSEIGDTVLLIYKNHGTTPRDFVIYENDPVSSDTIRTILASQTFNYKGQLVAKWIINSSEFAKGTDSGVESDLDFYFIVNGESSNNLNVNDSSTTPSNSPTVIIKEPKMDSKVRVGKVLEFNQTAKDADDDLRIRWTFEDGDNSDWMYNCLTTGNCNTTHAYDSSGTKIIEIIAREMTRTQEAVNYSQVFAYAPGINVFAVITSPPFGKIFTGPGAIAVPFNASRTYIANCTTLACSTCTYDVEDLHCYDLSKADIPSKYNLDFNWTFSEGVGRTGRWYPNTDYNRVVNFTRLFFAPTAHWAKLRVDYIPA